MKDLISVIIPVYNCEKYIDRCIKSVIDQTYKNIEIIIINDGSTDNSKSIIEKYTKKDSRIKFYDQKNMGVSTTRNNGIKYSTGKYITFIDSDDYYEKDAIEYLYNLIKDTDYDFVRGNYRLLKDDKVLEEGFIEKEEVTNYTSIYNRIFDAKLLCYTVLLLIKKEFLINNNIYFNKDISMMEDTIFYVTMYSKHPKSYLDNYVTYNYEFNINSASRSYKNSLNNIYNILEVNKIIQKKLEKEVYDKKFLNSTHYNMITNYLFDIYIKISKNLLNDNIMNILTDKRFLEIENNFSYRKNPHFLIGEFLLKHRLITLLKVFFKIRKVLKKVKL